MLVDEFGESMNCVSQGYNFYAQYSIEQALY